ncbi:MAG TPA: DUF1015 family protein, partial [Candidatus Solibacter sp.]|nr:DUF1015 family protein [Candidatus Solibacter sp.]
MAKIFPFQPYRYSEKAGPLTSLVTQPYDKISPAMQSRYLSLNPYNLVRVVLGERKPEDSEPGDSESGDSETGNVYTRAARLMEEWMASGILVQDARPGVFPYFQEFVVPDTGERLVRK